MSNLTEQQVMDLFKDAPEGYDWYLPESDTFYESWIKTKEGITVSEKRVLSGNIFSFDFNLDNLISNQGLIPKPVTAPVYTQMMADAGTLPSVGMECATSSGNVTLLLPIDDEGFGVIREAGAYVIICQSALKPLDTRTDTEKAIDSLDDFNLLLCNGWQEDLISFIKSGEFHGVTFTGES